METNNLSLRLETLPVTHDVVSTNRSQSPKRAAKHRSYRLSCTMVLQTADQFIDAFLGGSTRFRNGLQSWCPLAKRLCLDRRFVHTCLRQPLVD
jgi:hypothetical protein